MPTTCYVKYRLSNGKNRGTTRMAGLAGSIAQDDAQVEAEGFTRHPSAEGRLGEG
jgi:hypothetical protein